MIQQFPPTIGDLYAKTMKRVPEGDLELIRLILVWLLHVQGSITITDLQNALASNPDSYRFEPERVPSEAQIMTTCRGLVKIETETRHVRLVREY